MRISRTPRVLRGKRTAQPCCHLPYRQPSAQMLIYPSGLECSVPGGGIIVLGSSAPHASHGKIGITTATCRGSEVRDLAGMAERCAL